MALGRLWSFCCAGLALSATFFLSSCAQPTVKSGPAKPAGPFVSIDLLLTAEARRTPLGPATTSRSLAEQRGAELFFRELEAAGALKGVRFKFLLSRSAPPKPASPRGRKKTVQAEGLRRGAKPARKGPAKPKPSGPAKPARTSRPPRRIVGRYVSGNPLDRTALAMRSQRLPTVSCGPGVPGKEVVSLSGLGDGAAHKALSILRVEGHRELTLVADETAYGQRGRQLVGRLAESMGMRAHTIVIPSGGSTGLMSVLAKGRSLPILAWLEREGVENLIRTARKAAYQGPIILGPAAVHPLLASAPERRWSEEQMGPPNGAREEAILAVGHKLAAARALKEVDSQKQKLERFREIHWLAFKTPPPLLSACAYDALLFLTESLVRAADPKAIRSMGARALGQMFEREAFEGTLGTYRLIRGTNSLVKEGVLGEESFILLRARNGKWMPVKGSAKRLMGFRDKSFTPTRVLSPALKGRGEMPARGNATVPLGIRR